MSNNKALFIDGQVFQSAAWDRGMGKYSLFLLKALVKDSRYIYKKTYIIFTKNMPLEDNVRVQIEQTVPAAEILILDLKVPFDSSQDDVLRLQKVNEIFLNKAMEAYRHAALDIDFLILSLFIDQVVSVYPEGCRRVLLFYDLIPFQYHERYSKLPSFRNYLARYRTLFKADIILTISQTIADDVAVYLGIPPDKVFNIDGAPVERHTTIPKKPEKVLPERFLLMPSGDDLRKNNTRAVQAFEEYRTNDNDDDLFLLITSFFNEETMYKILTLSPNVIFTGNVPEAELRWLYQHCEALLFVPEYEGLGLPILEAAEADKPIICSNLEVFNEISTKAFYYSEPTDLSSIARAIFDAVRKNDFKTKATLYPEILSRYSWENTGEKALMALAGHKSREHMVPKKLKLAIFSPSPAGYSTIGKWVMQQHASLQDYFDIDYYLEPGKSHADFRRPDYLPFIAKALPAASFKTKDYKQYDAVLYHIGNSEFHLDTIKNALYLPGYAIFHDTYLADVFTGPLLEYGQITKDRLAAEELLDEKLQTKNSRYITSVANVQTGIIVHSAYAENAIKEVLQHTTPIIQAHLPIAVPEQKKLKVEGRSLVIGFAGIIHEAKGIGVIEKIAGLEKFSHCTIHIFGLSLVSEDVLRRLRSYPNVIIDTNLTDFEFQNMLKEVDVMVNFRKVYKGETSASTLEAMRYGAVPIVKRVGWYNELPSDVVVKVNNANELLKELGALVTEETRRKTMAKKAKELLTTSYTHEQYSRALYDFIVAGNGNLKNPNQKLATAIKSGLPKKRVELLVDL